MNKMTRVMILLFAAMLIPTFAFAASPWTSESTYYGKLTHKLEFGFKNTFLGLTEIVTEPKDHHKDVAETLKSVGVGLYHGFVNTVGGALHLITFPVTNLDVPLIHDGVHFE